jgi:hypothetical protein
MIGIDVSLDLASIRLTERMSGAETDVAVAMIKCLYPFTRGTRIRLTNRHDLIVRETPTAILRLIKALR